MNVPGLVDKVDSSEAGRKAVLGWKEKHMPVNRSSGLGWASKAAVTRTTCVFPLKP